MADRGQSTRSHRIPDNDDPFLQANASRMFRLLIAVGSYPRGHALIGDLMDAVWRLTGDAYKSGIDTIAVSEEPGSINDV